MLGGFAAAVAANVAANSLMMPPPSKPVWRGKAKLAANPFGGPAQHDIITLGNGLEPLAADSLETGWHDRFTVVDSWPAAQMPVSAAPAAPPPCSDCGGKVEEGLQAAEAPELNLLLWAAAGALVSKMQGSSIVAGAIAGAVAGWLVGEARK